MYNKCRSKMAHIILNVGGRRFETSLTTLKTISTYFVNLCDPSSSFYVEPKDGIFFIDREPNQFEHILTFARTNRLPPIVEDVEGLLVEAEYFDYEKLIRYLGHTPQWVYNKFVPDEFYKPDRCSRYVRNQHQSQCTRIGAGIDFNFPEFPDFPEPDFSEIEKTLKDIAIALGAYEYTQSYNGPEWSLKSEYQEVEDHSSLAASIKKLVNVVKKRNLEHISDSESD